MNRSIFTPKFFLVSGIIILAVLLRLIPHWPNFTPLAAMALFAGTYMKRKELAFALPFAALLISDIFIGFHQTMFAVYAGFAIIVAVGFLLRRNVKVHTVVMASLGASVLFYLITNFAVWASGTVGYPMNGAGLIQSYVAAIPFFRNALLGDLFYNTVFFGSFYFASLRFPVLARS
jgi:hypothetical protein